MKKSTSAHWNDVGDTYAREWQTGGKKYISDKERTFIKDVVTKYLSRRDSPTKAVDFGIGTGRILATLEQTRVIRDITGVDFSQSMLAYCKKRFKNSKIISHFVQADVSKKLPFKQETFNLVTSIRAIKYNKNWKDILVEFHRILRKSGILIFDMPNTHSVNRFSNDEVTMYKTTMGELSQVLKNRGFEVLEVKGGPILPGVLYDRPNPLLPALKSGEELFKSIFGELFLSRFLYIACRKI